MLKNNLFFIVLLMFGITFIAQNFVLASPPAPAPPVCEFTGEVTNLLDLFNIPITAGQKVESLEIRIKSTGRQLGTGDEFFKDVFQGCKFFDKKSIKAFISTDNDRRIKFKIGDQISGKLLAEGYNKDTFLTLNGVYDLTILNGQTHDNPSVSNVKLQWWNPISWVRILWVKLFR